MDVKITSWKRYILENTIFHTFVGHSLGLWFGIILFTKMHSNLCIPLFQNFHQNGRIIFRSKRFVNTGSGSGRYFLHFTSYFPLIKSANSSTQNKWVLNSASKLFVGYANYYFECITHNVSIWLKLITQVTNSENAFLKCNIRDELYSLHENVIKHNEWTGW